MWCSQAIGSSDPDGDTITYAWEFESKPSDSQVSLSDGSAKNPTFTADVIGDYVVNLVVSDGTASSDPDTVTVQISAANQPPVADAGPDQSVTTGDSVTLDGSQSLDPSGAPSVHLGSTTVLVRRCYAGRGYRESTEHRSPTLGPQEMSQIIPSGPMLATARKRLFLG